MSLINLTHIARSSGDPQSSGPAQAHSPARIGWRGRSAGFQSALASPSWSHRAGLHACLDSSTRRVSSEPMVHASWPAQCRRSQSTSRSVSPLGSRATSSISARSLSALHPDNPKRNNAAVALVLVAGITWLDFVAYSAVKATHHANEETSAIIQAAVVCLGVQKPREALLARTFRRHGTIEPKDQLRPLFHTKRNRLSDVP